MTAFLFAAGLLVAPGAPAGRLVSTRRALSVRHLITAGAILAAVVAVATDKVLVTVAVTLAAMTGLWVLNDRREQGQRAREREVIADFLGHMLADLRAGATIAHACHHAASRVPTSSPPDVRIAITRADAYVRRGGSGATAFLDAEAEELRRLGNVWALAENHGIPLATLLEKARDRIDTAQRHRAATQSSLAGPQSTALVLAVLPVAGIGMGMLMGANPVKFLTTTSLGGVLLLVGTALTCTGILISHVIVARAAA